MVLNPLARSRWDHGKLPHGLGFQIVLSNNCINGKQKLRHREHKQNYLRIEGVKIYPLFQVRRTDLIMVIVVDALLYSMLPNLFEWIGSGTTRLGEPYL